MGEHLTKQIKEKEDKRSLLGISGHSEEEKRHEVTLSKCHNSHETNSLKHTVLKLTQEEQT